MRGVPIMKKLSNGVAEHRVDENDKNGEGVDRNVLGLLGKMGK